jgi:2-dehydropantoate 2-reductase
MARIAVIGPGAVGGTIAAWLYQDRAHEVVLCVRSPIDALRVDTPDGPIEAKPRVLTSPRDATAVDWVIAATKTYDCAAAAAWLPGLLAEDAFVAVLQNGIEHRSRFAGVVPETRIVPAIVDIPAERTGPGCILQRRHGWVVVPDGAAGQAFADLFAHTSIEVSASGAFEAVAWRKLAINCAGAVNALALKPARVAHDEAVAEVMRGLVRECMAVGRAEGVELPDDLPEQVVAHYRNSPPDSINSLHADHAAGRPTEVDARNGVIPRLGARHGIDAPLNRMVMALLSAA